MLIFLATKRFVEAVIGSEPFGDDGPQAHKYVAEGFLKHDRLQYYFDTVRSEVTKQWENLAAKESFDLFPEVRNFVDPRRFCAEFVSRLIPSSLKLFNFHSWTIRFLCHIRPRGI
jgi:hypothetical protein